MVLEQKPNGLDSELVRCYIFQLCTAIHWCNNNDVILRDVRPEILLVNPDHTLKLCDFDFARTVQQVGQNLTESRSSDDF